MTTHPRLPVDGQELLRLIFLAQTAAEAEPFFRPLTMPVKTWVERYGRCDAIRRGLGVRISGDWLGRVPGMRKRRNRHLRRLAAVGMVRLASWRPGRRISHVVLTEAGREIASHLANPRATRTANTTVSPS